ncbi:MAG: deoxyribose-phosphate aldolase [Verrucomicrobia bacterium]|nr:deoxyribose-phosphate aldolase [Verrucomicrobiota bacterium]MCH8513976.1 deoxyribose-phosphate aldolase [Kiritimatiellia bacterium]
MNPINTYLDAAILKPEMNRAEVQAAVDLCLPFHPRTFCVRPADIPFFKPICKAHGIGLCVVLGFPHGDQLSASKADEADRYVEAGVDEIDMVANFGWVRSGMWTEVRKDIEAVAAMTIPAGVPLKVIFETVHLHPEEIRKLVEVCVDAGAQFVKTSTGFNGDGANMEVVKIMIEAAAGRIEVKPSGGIRTREQAEVYVHMGASRLGVGFGSVPGLCGDGPVSSDSY